MLKAEGIKAIHRESAFSKELLASLITQAESKYGNCKGLLNRPKPTMTR